MSKYDLTFTIEDVYDALIDSEHTNHILHNNDKDNKTVTMTNHVNAISKEHLEVHNRFPRNRTVYQNNNYRYERNRGGRGHQQNGQYNNRTGGFNINTHSNEKCEDCGLSNNDINKLLWKVHNSKENICFLRGPNFNKHIPTRERLLQREALDNGKQHMVNRVNISNDNDSDSLKLLVTNLIIVTKMDRVTMIH